MTQNSEIHSRKKIHGQSFPFPIQKLKSQLKTFPQRKLQVKVTYYTHIFQIMEMENMSSFILWGQHYFDTKPLLEKKTRDQHPYEIDKILKIFFLANQK